MPFISSARKSFGPQGKKNTKYRSYQFSTHTFTSAGVTGRYGPTLGQIQSAYSSASWAQNTSNLNQGSYQGYQDWKVPQSGEYDILINGAASGGGQAASGSSAIVRARVSLLANEIITICVGQQQGPNQNSSWFGGSGGTFVIRKNGNIPLVIAGGSATQSGGTIPAAMTIQSNGGAGSSSGTNYAQNNGGTNGNGGGGGSTGGAGGGFLSAGASTSYGAGGLGFNNGLVGGSGTSSNGSFGGFGGGGGGDGQNYGSSGAAGGYSGGGSNGASGSTVGGYGGSYIIPGATNLGTSTGLYNGSSNLSGQSIANLGFGSNNTNGFVTITFIR